MLGARPGTSLCALGLCHDPLVMPRPLGQSGRVGIQGTEREGGRALPAARLPCGAAEPVAGGVTMLGAVLSTLWSVAEA